jgi:hypothetical protein
MNTEALLTLQAQLAEAKLAKHKIAMGQQLITLSYSAEGTNSQQYGPAQLPMLERHIAQLEAEIARAQGIGIRRAFTIA